MRNRGDAWAARLTGYQGFFVILCLTMAASLVLAAGSAFADDSHPLQATFSSQGANPSGIGIDEASGNALVAVGRTGSVNIFGAEGAGTVGVSEAEIGGFGWGGEPLGVAVDNSATSPSEGALYVAEGCLAWSVSDGGNEMPTLSRG